MVSLLAVNWDALLTAPNMPFVAVFGSGTAIAMFAIGAAAWRNVQRHRREVQLKRDLAAGGYSVDEIERIVRVSSGEEGE